VLLWENFETTKDPNVVRLGHVTQMAQPQALFFAVYIYFLPSVGGTFRQSWKTLLNVST
jgi:hypothetical protein